MVRVPFPNQISSVPEIDREALGWSQVLVDAIGKLRISELAIGLATATWPGGQTFSTALNVTHSLSVPARAVFTQPLAVVPGSNGPAASAIGPNPNPQQFQVQWFTIDGVNPAAATTMAFYWLAMN